MSVVNKIHAKLTGEAFLRQFLGRSLTAFAIKLGSAGLSYVMFVALARAMEREAYGLFSAVFSLAMLLAVLGSFGQRPVVLRFGAAYHEAGDHALRRGVIRRGYGIVLAGTVVAGVLGAMLYQLTGGGAGTGLWARLDVGWIAAITGLSLAWALVEYQSFVMRISSSVSLALMPRDILWRAGICLVAGAAALGHLPLALSPQGWCWLLSLTLLAVGLLQFALHERQGEAARVFGPARRRAAEWNAPVRNLWLSSVVMLAAQSLSVILIERQIGPEEAGPYFSALRTAQLLNLFLFATSVICSPMLSRSLARGDHDETQKVCTLTALVGGGFGVLGFVVILFAGGVLLRLFGEGFDSATLALGVLAAGFLVNTLAGPTGPLLEMSGHEKAYFRALLWANALGLAAMPLMILWIGPLGAALATAAIAICWNLSAVVHCRRVIGVDPSVLVFLLGKPAAPEPAAD